MSVPFVSHGLTLAFAWFLLVNAGMCVLTAAIAALVSRANVTRGPRFWIALRLMPSAAALLFVLALFAPSYWQYEPRENVEGFDLMLALVAAFGVAVIAGAAARGVTAWRSASRRIRNWMRHARPMSVSGAPLPAYAVDADQPMIALVGVFRPRLLLTRGLIDALTPLELEAAVAHELGHQRSFDNLKRLAMRAAPDLLSSSHVARVIEQRWASAAEHVADRIGGPDGIAARCALASALVKVARLTPAAIPTAEPISTLISGGDIASRVRSLLADEVGNPARPSRGRWAALAGLATIAVVVYGPLLRAVHEATELIVRTIP